ncbi:MAG: hypothetical protein DHS20C21_16730 [Gemmatimonadota bacterium]|nr:MAG: hypothetical protein DHS20C21_16730 [Gemmatimonadota bacterium]
MLFRLKVLEDSVDSDTRSLQARGATPELTREEAARTAADLEAGAVVRFYRGGPPHGRVITARATDDGIWLKLRFRTRDADIWRLVETGAVNTIEVQTFDSGVDVFMKSVAATYPSVVG